MVPAKKKTAKKKTAKKKTARKGRASKNLFPEIQEVIDALGKIKLNEAYHIIFSNNRSVGATDEQIRTELLKFFPQKEGKATIENVGMIRSQYNNGVGMFQKWGAPAERIGKFTDDGEYVEPRTYKPRKPKADKPAKSVGKKAAKKKTAKKKTAKKATKKKAAKKKAGRKAAR